MKKILRAVVCLTLVLTMLFASCAPAMAAGTTQVLRVNGHGVRMHYNTKGGGDATKILSLSKGTKVLFLSKPDKAWVKVRTANGLEGYVFRDYLDVVNTVNKSSIYVVKSGKTWGYRTANAKKPSVTLLGGTMVAVGSTKGSMSYVMTLNGSKYYVKTSDLRKLF